MTGHKLYVNGIDGTTGHYLVEPMEYSEIAAIIRDDLVKDKAKDQDTIRQLKDVQFQKKAKFGARLDLRPEVVASVGWAVIFHKDEEQSVKDALAPLVEHRRRQINNDEIVKTLQYPHCSDEGQSKSSWLDSYFVGAGDLEETKIPFYLLIVGSPEHISFEFSYELSVEYAVGRLHFDTAGEYSHYVDSILDYESSETVPNAKEVAFFSPRHEFDMATQLSADKLVSPLADGIPANGSQKAEPDVATRWGFGSRKFWGDTATKEALDAIVAPAAGGKTPAFLFTASHGMGWPKGHCNQSAAQGALLCQDWPGFGSAKPDHYFAGADVPSEGRVHGMIAFHFACYSVGTPSHDRFFHKPQQQPPAIAEQPFISALSKAWLTHPEGGALACLGHIERAWGCSIETQAGPRLLPFRNAIGRILLGQPVGYAMKDFYDKYASLSVSLSERLREISFGNTTISTAELASNWIERNDAGGYLLIGDPAAHLRPDNMT